MYAVTGSRSSTSASPSVVSYTMLAPLQFLEKTHRLHYAARIDADCTASARLASVCTAAPLDRALDATSALAGTDAYTVTDAPHPS